MPPIDDNKAVIVVPMFAPKRIGKTPNKLISAGCPEAMDAAIDAA